LRRINVIDPQEELSLLSERFPLPAEMLGLLRVELIRSGTRSNRRKAEQAD
jgi:hypothetical protein